MFKIAILLFGLLAIPFGQAQAGTIIYGNPVVAGTITAPTERGVLVVQTARTALYDGGATSWSVYSTPGTVGTVAAVIMKPTGTPGYYTITGVSQGTVTHSGVNTFSWSRNVPGDVNYGTNLVTVGSVFGIWVGTTGIDRSGVNAAGADQIKLYNNPSPGTDFGPYDPVRAFNGLYASNVNTLWTTYGGSPYVNITQGRTYSFDITVVPEASSLGLMGLGMLGLAWSVRRKKATALAC
ncbi:MAG: PEP-CTERM sorting domain-containing protein [Methylococcales bacterium]|nr:PEP-CTERM sorting domain-containing protein [Methylococcales bacterium]